MLIGTKIGSSLLTNGGGEVNEQNILEICRQTSELAKEGHGVFLVSSGAVHSCHDENLSKNSRAAIGQVALISKYWRFYQIFGITPGMILLTDHDLRDFEVFKKTLLELIAAGYIIILNANDPVDNNELKELVLDKNLKDCADNDRLFLKICQIVGADIAIIGFDGPGFICEGEKIDKINVADFEKYIPYAQGGGKFGHGSKGMLTKLEVSKEMIESGIKPVLAPGREKDFIIRAAKFEPGFGTQFEK